MQRGAGPSPEEGGSGRPSYILRWSHTASPGSFPVSNPSAVRMKDCDQHSAEQCEEVKEWNFGPQVNFNIAQLLLHRESSISSESGTSCPTRSAGIKRTRAGSAHAASPPLLPHRCSASDSLLPQNTCGLARREKGPRGFTPERMLYSGSSFLKDGRSVAYQ